MFLRWIYYNNLNITFKGAGEVGHAVNCIYIVSAFCFYCRKFDSLFFLRQCLEFMSRHYINLFFQEAHVNTCYKHFYYFVTEYSLVDKKELEPLVWYVILLIGILSHVFTFYCLLWVMFSLFTIYCELCFHCLLRVMFLLFTVYCESCFHCSPFIVSHVFTVYWVMFSIFTVYSESCFWLILYCESCFQFSLCIASLVFTFQCLLLFDSN